MAKILSFVKPGLKHLRQHKKCKAKGQGGSAERRALAHHFILQASSLLEDLGSEEQRVGWLLDDCARLIVRRDKPRPQQDAPSPSSSCSRR